MMLFKPEHVDPIIEGIKTQTRRIWPHGRRVKPGSIHQARLTLFGKPFCYLKIVDVYREQLGTITNAEAAAEGYPDRDAYLKAFCRINHCDYDFYKRIWVIKFEVFKKGLADG